MPGAFVAIVGPSGAGKDTLIAEARAALAGRPDFVFVRRLVTRAANAFEDHDTIGEAEFAAGYESGGFALSWRAHGLGYALPASTLAAVEAGSVAICNLSRGALPEAHRRFPRVVVIFVTAPPEVIAARLVARGRENEVAIRQRIERESSLCDPVDPDLRLVNDRPLDVTSGELVTFLSRLKETQAA